MPVMSTISDDLFDCLILSGGGGKGSYGAGAASALSDYYELKGITPNLCILGTSAGALNACTLACYGAERLVELWGSSVSNKAILGAKKPKIKTRFVLEFVDNFIRSSPYSIFENKRLRQIVETNVDFDLLADKHLVLLVTNYTQGTLEAFYVSDLIEQFVTEDTKLPLERQRLQYFKRINNQAELVDVLLASAAIPVFFPPVKINGNWYVDGGIANNTPTREAARFLRWLSETKRGLAGDVYCVTQDKPSIINQNESFGLLDIVQRTTELSLYLHMEPIISGIDRINRETREYKSRIDGLVEQINAKSYTDAIKSEIIGEIRSRIGSLGGATARLDINFLRINPSVELGDTLDFSPATMKRNLNHGYHDMLKTLGGKLNAVERQKLAAKTFD